jgi:hypothetical protein
MPTAAKLFAAFGFLAVGFFAAQVVMPHLSDGTQFGAFVPISALIGLVCGWRVMGPTVRKGDYAAAASGIKTSVIMVLVALFIFSTYRMLENAFRRQYDGPMDAVVGIVAIGIDYGRVLGQIDVLSVLLLGGALAGLLSEWAARRWP